MPLAPAPPAVEEAAPETPATPATTFEGAKAARREGPPPEAEPVKPAGTVVPIEMDAAQLAAATALSKENRAARAKLKELEAKTAEAEPLTKAKALVAEGKHLEAIRAIGADLNAAVAEELGTAPAPAEVDPEAAKVKADLEALKAKDAERTKAEEEAAKAAATAAREADIEAVANHVKAEAGKYPFLSRRVEWVREAYEGAAAAYPALVEKLGRDLKPEERHRLILAGLEEAEEEHKKTAQIYGAPVTLDRKNGATPQKASARPTTFDSSMRGGTATPAPKKTKVTFEQAKRERRN